jgi:hypothetical protein
VVPRAPYFRPCGAAKIRTTLTIDEEVMRAVKVRGARTGKGDVQVIEEALRRELGLHLLEWLLIGAVSPPAADPQSSSRAASAAVSN